MKKKVFFAQSKSKNSSYKIYSGLWFLLICLVHVTLTVLLYRMNAHNALFGKTESALGQYVNMSGTFLGGIMLIFGLWLNSRKLAVSIKQSSIAESSQLNTRFKDAADLLASENVSATLSGIYALHQIAVETDRFNEEQKGDVKIVHEILCAYIRESTCEVEDIKSGKTMATNNKRPIVIQTILKVLSNNENNIYSHLVTDLSNCVFKNITLEEAHFNNVDFSNTLFLNCNFSNSAFYSCYFMNARFGNVELSESLVKESLIKRCRMNFVAFKNVTIEHSDFSENLLFEVVKKNVKRLNLRFVKNTKNGIPVMLY